MDKELFVKIINRIKKCFDNSDAIYDLTDGKIDILDIDGISTIDLLIELLEIQMCDIGGDIVYFIYELDFGAGYEDGCVVGGDGTHIDFSTAEKLYDFLAARRTAMAMEQDEEIRSTPVN